METVIMLNGVPAQDRYPVVLIYVMGSTYQPLNDWGLISSEFKKQGNCLRETEVYPSSLTNYAYQNDHSVKIFRNRRHETVRSQSCATFFCHSGVPSLSAVLLRKVSMLSIAVTWSENVRISIGGGIYIYIYIFDN